MALVEGARGVSFDLTKKLHDNEPQANINQLWAAAGSKGHFPIPSPSQADMQHE